ncbi:hypothetical protein SAMN05421503_3279 [Terribacillus aidingensis]|uniref:DUF1433 domain-containing protein n=2 Tax=Terribacillus aidingensis TaxID=586416 RepID=A0A285P8E9_9BACI|nr:hypothetical protein [Terribacillus aidingensis]SNZ17537.1 hypothetical protein SAMN05421503_3279 [Terribacillus aidingensis]
MKIYKIGYILTIISIVLLGGCGVKDNYDEDTIAKAQDVTKRYIENNYDNIESIKVDEPRESPMGSIKVDGIVNGNAEFTVSLSEDFSVNSIGEKEGFPNRKNECQDTDCAY